MLTVSLSESPGDDFLLSIGSLESAVAAGEAATGSFSDILASSSSCQTLVSFVMSSSAVQSELLVHRGSSFAEKG